MSRKDTWIVTTGRLTALVLGLVGAAAAHAGTPGFAAQQAFAAGSNPNFVISADLNGDGKPDLIVADGSDDAVVVLINTTPAGATTATYTVQQSFAVDDYAWSIAVADVNGDGKPDIIVSYLDNMGVVSVLLNTTTPGSTTASFAAPVDFAIGNGMAAWVAAADLDGDGKPDLVVTNNTDGTVSVLTNTTANGASVPSFAPQMVFPAGDAPRCVTIADLDGDGHPDLAITAQADDAVVVLTNGIAGGSLTFSAPQPISLGFEPLMIASGDLNGDGLADLVVSDANGSDVAVLMDTSTGGTLSFAAPQSLSTAHIAQSLLITDLDGDGKADLAVAYFLSSSIDVFSNDTADGDTLAAFSAPLSLATGNGPYVVTAADVNGDGLPDLVTVNFDDSTVGVALNTTGQSESQANGGSLQSSATRACTSTKRGSLLSKLKASGCSVKTSPAHGTTTKPAHGTVTKTSSLPGSKDKIGTSN